jgi:hypothetical protein
MKTARGIRWVSGEAVAPGSGAVPVGRRWNSQECKRIIGLTSTRGCRRDEGSYGVQ